MKMKAIVYEKYGQPEDVLELKDAEKPTPKDNEVLVKIHASSICWADNAIITGKPFLVRLTGGLLKPKHLIPGIDISGKVEEVGKNVTRFKLGDEIFGDIGDFGFGAFAEYVCAPEDAIALKPVNMSYEQAAVVPQYAVVALQGLRDKGQIQKGHKVLINGASGGVGTFAVQIAKSFGAEVTGVCSSKNLDMVRSIGAEHVIDYTKEDFTTTGKKYDLILDIVANRSVFDYTGALTPKGSYVAVAFKASVMFVGPIISMTGNKRIIQLSHKPNFEDLIFMKELIESGKVIPVIDRQYSLGKVSEAVRYFNDGNPAGKIGIKIDNKDNDKT